MNLPRAIVRHRIPIALAWAAACAVLLPTARLADKRLDAGTRIEGSESAQVDDALRTRFESPFAHYGVLVATGLPPVGTEQGNDALRLVAGGVQATAGVTAVLSRLNVVDTLFVGAGGDGSYLLVGLDPTADPEAVLVGRLRRSADSLTALLRADHPAATLRWTGPGFLSQDLRRASSEGARRSEIRALPLTLALLVVAFGAVVAALVPLVFGVLAIGTALGVTALLAATWPLSILLQSVVSILGLALGIDYALLMVSRFREARALGRLAVEAGEDAARYAGHTVLLSGCSVAIGFVALLLVPINELRSVAVGGLLVVMAAVLLATTLLPALLVWLAPVIDRGRVWRHPLGTKADERWRRWGLWVTRHPVLILLLAAPPTVLLALPAARLDPQVPQTNWLPRAQESAQAIDELQAMQRGRVVRTARVLLHLPPGTNALDAEGWTATARLSAAFHADPRVDRVRSLPALTERLPIPWQLVVETLPDTVRRAFVSRDGRSAFLEVIPLEEISPKEVVQMVRDFRDIDAPATAGLTGSQLQVGGLPAQSADYEDIVAGHFPFVILLVVGGTFFALMIGFRSLLIPLKALVLNLLTVGAAYGATVLVFQDGWGAQLFGLSEPLQGVFPAVPILMFCTLFGLSMDYEVFLVARVAEARHAHNPSHAIAEGLARTGRLITSAASIMVVIFAAFALADYLPIQLLGFSLAVAVLVDATVVRLAIGPALLQLAGKWNWWPGDGR